MSLPFKILKKVFSDVIHAKNHNFFLLTFYPASIIKDRIHPVVNFMLFIGKCIRACLKNHSCNLHVPICGIFCLHSVDVARYGALIQAKSPTNCNAHLTESIFQTRSSFRISRFIAVISRSSPNLTKNNSRSIILYLKEILTVLFQNDL